MDPAPPNTPHAGWITVRAPSDRASAVNRVLAERGIFASAIDATSDLESVFLSLTAGAGMDIDSATHAGPPPGWGSSEAPR